jgi:serine/threonine protein phosphatase PrpC
MAALTSQISQTLVMSSKVIQATSKQDIALHGFARDKSFSFILVADNHGRGLNKFYTKNIIENIDWSSFLLEKHWKKTLIKITSVDNTYCIGTTITIVKIYIDKIIIDWLGDSSAKIYSNNSIIWETKDHDNKNIEDIQRLSSNHFEIKYGWDIQVIDSKNIKSIKSATFKKNMDGLNMTRALGHKGIYIDDIHNFDSKTILKKSGKKYKCIVATDGMWQMTCPGDLEFLSNHTTTANEIADFALQRWKQKWIHDNTMGTIKTVSFPDWNIDDIGVAVYTD